MASSRRKGEATPTDLSKMITNHIEERNYLIFTIAERDPVKIKELGTWSLEALYQFLYANSIHAKRLQDRKKTDMERQRALGRK